MLKIFFSMNSRCDLCKKTFVCIAGRTQRTQPFRHVYKCLTSTVSILERGLMLGHDSVIEGILQQVYHLFIIGIHEATKFLIKQKAWFFHAKFVSDKLKSLFCIDWVYLVSTREWHYIFNILVQKHCTLYNWGISRHIV